MKVCDIFVLMSGREQMLGIRSARLSDAFILGKAGSFLLGSHCSSAIAGCCCGSARTRYISSRSRKSPCDSCCVALPLTDCIFPSLLASDGWHKVRGLAYACCS